MQCNANRLRPGIHLQKIALFVLLILLSSTPLFAQFAVGGGAFATRGFRGRAPLKVAYSLSLPPSTAMGFVTVTITDTRGISNADRKLAIVLYTQNYGQASDQLAYRTDVVLAEGTKSVQVEIPFPASENQFAWDVGLFEEGRDIEDKRKSKISNPNEQDFHWAFNSIANSAPIAGLLATTVDPKLESQSLRTISNHIETQLKNAQAATLPGTAVAVNSQINETLISVDKASDDWRHYFAYTQWIVSVNGVAEINDKYPQVAAALRTYVSAGGALLVYQVDSQESMASVNRLLSAPGGNAEFASWKSINQTAPAWWIIDADEDQGGQGKAKAAEATSQTKIESGGAIYDAALLADTLLETGLGTHRDNLQDVMAVLGFDDDSIWQLDEGRSRLMNSLSTNKLLERPYGRGIVIICNKRLDELTSNQVALIANHNQDKQVSTLTLRSRDASWFWQNLILEVGKPPVWAFCVIVALFGALLGPGLLAFTGHIQRRSLMIFLVPVVSFVATIAIILYGVLHEGFDTHVRIHSVTAYDSPAQVAFAWSRQNYFSGLPPREGLQFTRDTYARSVAPDDQPNYRNIIDPRRGLDGTVSFGEKQTWYDWLKPRQHQQLLVGHKVDARTIPISTERSAAGKLVLKNLTDMTLPLVVLRGAKDDYYFEAYLGPNESREPEVQDLESVRVAVSRRGVDFKPRVPPELEGGGDSLLNFGNPRRYGRTTYVGATEVISTAFTRYLTDDLVLEPHEFATVVPHLDAIEIPLKGIQSDNVNLVIGVDPW